MGLLVVGSVRWDRLKLGLDTLPLIELVDLDNFEMRQSEDFFSFSNKLMALSADTLRLVLFSMVQQSHPYHANVIFSTVRLLVGS